MVVTKLIAHTPFAVGLNLSPQIDPFEY
jgi:hypothetical protein